MKDFETRNQYLSSFVLSIYVLGYAVGPLLISPFSELYGRLPIYHCCNVLFTICTWRCAYAGTLRNLAVLRFFAGVGGSSVFALVPSSIADMIVKERRAPIFGLIALGYNLGPAVSPTAGSYINAALGWKWIFHVTAILGGAMTVLAIPCLYETYEPTLLRRKAKKQRKTIDNPHLRSRLDIKSGSTKPKILARAMVMPLRMLATPPIFLVSLLTAVGYGWLYILYITLPHTFLFKYGWPSRNIGLAYLGTAVGNIVGMVVGVGVSDAIMKRKAARGDRRPENRLLPMVYLWPLVSIGLVIYGWTAQTVTHFMGPMIGTAIFGAGVMAAIVRTSCGYTLIYANASVLVLHRHLHSRRVPPSQCFWHGSLLSHTIDRWRASSALFRKAIHKVRRRMGFHTACWYCARFCADTVARASIW
jgi:multidrug resistance protein